MTAADDRCRDIRSEQMRLVLEGVAQSVAVGFLVSTLMVVVLWALVPHVMLICWYAAFLLERASAAMFAHRALRSGHESRNYTERILTVSKAVEGSILGTLLWIGLPVHEPPVSILLMSLMGAICGNGVSLLAPRPRLYLALAMPLAAIAIVVLAGLGGLPYKALAACCALYVIGQYGQVRLAHRRLTRGIELQFENSALVERLRLETQVAHAARSEAEQADAAKSHFLAAASHDLRQPVHALGLFLQALRQTPLDATQRRIVESAQAAGFASADMLNTLLDFSRIEAGVITPVSGAFPLQPLLDKLEQEIAPLADEKRIAYRTTHTDQVIVSDPSLLEPILRNLLLNAIRYTERGGLLIGCRRKGATVSIEIYDTGIGIPADQHDAIFGEFRQLGNPERDRRKGLGLGLAIVKGLAIRLDHALSLSSIEGRGSVFRILVPLANSAPRPIAPAASLDAGSALSGKTILVVDDDASVREAMLHLIAGWFGHGTAVESWQEAIRQGAVDAPPDIIVCDYRLRGGETGAQTIARLRRFWRRDVPALLVTGDTAPARLREATESGLPLIHKPVSPRTLYVNLMELGRTAT